MLITTTPTIEGHHITAYHGVVCSEVVAGINVVKDMFAGIRDIVGGRSNSYEHELTKARDSALRELEHRAEKMGANAVVGVDIDYEVLGNSMLMISASGTAVTMV